MPIRLCSYLFMTLLGIAVWAAAKVEPRSPLTRRVVLEVESGAGDSPMEERFLLDAQRSVLLRGGEAVGIDALGVGDELALDNGRFGRIVGLGTGEPMAPLAPGTSRVVGVLRRGARQSVRVRTARDTVVTTPDHRFRVVGAGWVPASRLRVGQELDGLVPEGSARIEGVEGEPNQGVEVYNLLMQGDPTFRVGGAGLLVHNGQCFGKPRSASSRRAPEAGDPPPVVAARSHRPSNNVHVILSAHGGMASHRLDPMDKPVSFKVPSNVTIQTYAPPGSTLTVRAGNHIEHELLQTPGSPSHRVQGFREELELRPDPAEPVSRGRRFPWPFVPKPQTQSQATKEVPLDVYPPASEMPDYRLTPAVEGDSFRSQIIEIRDGTPQSWPIAEDGYLSSMVRRMSRDEVRMHSGKHLVVHLSTCALGCGYAYSNQRVDLKKHVPRKKVPLIPEPAHGEEPPTP